MTSIIIVSFNRWDLVQKCLKAVFQNAPKDTEVIVVDNASTDETPKIISQKFPKVKLIKNKLNAGFSKGNNQGAKIAHGDNLLFLNTDCFLESGAVESLEQFLQTHPDAGAVGPQLRNFDGSIQPSGGYFPHLWQIFLIMSSLDNWPVIRKYAPSIHIRHPEFFTQIQKINWLAGAALLVRRDLFEKIGGYDEKIFMYGEEVELCYRIHQAGFQIYLVPQIQLVHLGFASSKGREFGIIKEMESFKFFYKKHKPNWQFPILILLMILGCLLRIGRGLITLNPQMIKTYFLALKTILKN